MDKYLIFFTILGAIFSMLDAAVKKHATFAHYVLWAIAALWVLQLAYELGRVV